jgi:hypothetical protein
MTQMVYNSSNTDHVHPEVAIAEQEVSHPLFLNAVVKGSPILMATVIGCGCAYVGLNNPETHEVFPKCGFYAATGFYCPGCGMTRAVHSMLHGNIVRAVQFNAILVVAMPVLIYLYTWWMTWAFTGKELPKLKLSKKVIWTLVVIAVVFSVGRNLPGSFPAFFARDRV